MDRDLGLSRDTLQAEFFAPHFHDVVHGRARLRDRLGPVLLEHAPHLNCGRLIEYWFTHDAQLDLSLLAQLDSLRQRGLQLHLATVQEHERAEFLWQQLGLRERFDAMHYAADIGWAKPAAEFFKAVETRSGFSSEEIFFIDDKVDNVEAARRCGWRAAVWTGESTVEQLLQDARSRVASAVVCSGSAMRR